MPVAYLTAAVLSALSMAMLWLYAGGGWWTAALVYVLSGNLVLWGLILRAALRSDGKADAATPPDDAPQTAKEE